MSVSYGGLVDAKIRASDLNLPVKPMIVSNHITREKVAGLKKKFKILKVSKTKWNESVLKEMSKKGNISENRNCGEQEFYENKKNGRIFNQM